MPRVNKVETCMICEQMPCGCNAKPQKTARPKQLKKLATGRARQPGKNEGEQAGLVGPGDSGLSPSSPVRRHDLTEEQLVFVGALRVLAPILHETELDKYSGLLLSKETVKERSAFWRARRKDGAAGSRPVQGTALASPDG